MYLLHTHEFLLVRAFSLDHCYKKYILLNCLNKHDAMTSSPAIDQFCLFLQVKKVNTQEASDFTGTKRTISEGERFLHRHCTVIFGIK